MKTVEAIKFISDKQNQIRTKTEKTKLDSAYEFCFYGILAMSRYGYTEYTSRVYSYLAPSLFSKLKEDGFEITELATHFDNVHFLISW